MLSIKIFILVGIISVSVPAMMFILTGTKFNNFSRSLIIFLSSVIFAVAPAYYIYSNQELYIMGAFIIALSLLAGIFAFIFFEKNHPVKEEF